MLISHRLTINEFINEWSNSTIRCSECWIERRVRNIRSIIHALQLTDASDIVKTSERWLQKRLEWTITDKEASIRLRFTPQGIQWLVSIQREKVPGETSGRNTTISVRHLLYKIQRTYESSRCRSTKLSSSWIALNLDSFLRVWIASDKHTQIEWTQCTHECHIYWITKRNEPSELRLSKETIA